MVGSNGNAAVRFDLVKVSATPFSPASREFLRRRHKDKALAGIWKQRVDWPRKAGHGGGKHLVTGL